MRMSVVDSVMAGYSSASSATSCVRFNGCITKDTPPPFNLPSTTFWLYPSHPSSGERVERCGRRRRAQGPGGRGRWGRAEGLPWERQPREGEEAYTAFLAYRDLGPGGPTRRRANASASPRATSSRSSGGRPRASGAGGQRLGRPPASRARQGRRGGGGKWERRRLQALEEGWQTCRHCGPGWIRCSPCPRRRRPRPRPTRPEKPEAIPDAVRRPRRPGDGGTRADAVQRLDAGPVCEAGRRAGVGPPERGLAAPRDDRPADGDGRGVPGLPDPQSPLRPTAAALNRLITPRFVTPQKNGQMGVGRVWTRRGCARGRARRPGGAGGGRSIARRVAPCDVIAGSRRIPRQGNRPRKWGRLVSKTRIIAHGIQY